MFSLSLRTFLESLEGQDALLGVFLLGAGVVFMTLGLRIFQILVAGSFAFVGFALGASLPVEPVVQWMVGGLGGLAMAVISKYFIKSAVAVLAGGWAGVATLIICSNTEVRDDFAIVMACLAFVALISLSSIVYTEIVVLVMSFEGALLFLAGAVVFFSHNSVMWGHVRGLVLDAPLFPVFLLISGTVTGFYLQVAEAQKKEVGTSG